MVTLTQQDNIHILTMEEGISTELDNDSISALHETLDAIEAKGDGPGALVLTGSGKAFSTGINLAAVMQYTPEQLETFSVELPRLFARLLNFPLPTIAAINGHTFAGGAFLALVCDYRIMREDRGWFCISEVDVGVPIGDEMMAVAQAKLAPTVFRDAVLSGKRFGGKECTELGLVDACCSEDELLPKAIEMITPLSTKERGIFKALKTSMYGGIAENLVASKKSV